MASRILSARVFVVLRARGTRRIHQRKKAGNVLLSGAAVSLSLLLVSLMIRPIVVGKIQSTCLFCVPLLADHPPPRAIHLVVLRPVFSSCLASYCAVTLLNRPPTGNFNSLLRTRDWLSNHPARLLGFFLVSPFFTLAPEWPRACR